MYVAELIFIMLKKNKENVFKVLKRSFAENTGYNPHNHATVLQQLLHIFCASPKPLTRIYVYMVRNSDLFSVYVATEL